MSNEKLTPQQERAIELLLSGYSTVHVCDELQIERTTLWRWRQNPQFDEEYRASRNAISEKTREMLSLAAGRAVKRLVELMEDTTSVEVPASVQYASARSLLELSFKGMELADVQESVEELRRLLGEPKKGLRAA